MEETPKSDEEVEAGLREGIEEGLVLVTRIGNDEKVDLLLAKDRNVIVEIDDLGRRIENTDLLKVETKTRNETIVETEPRKTLIAILLVVTMIGVHLL